MEVLSRKAELLEVIGALHTSRSFTRRLNGRKKKADQNTNNGNDDQEFDKGKTLSVIKSHGLGSYEKIYETIVSTSNK